MKRRFLGFCYRSSFVFCLWAFLSLFGLMFLSSSAFAQPSEDFYYTESGGTITITGYIGPSGVVVIPADIGGMPVVGIGYKAFAYSVGLTSVIIPNSVTSIEAEAFFYCDGLTSVTIPNSVMSIGEFAFAACTGLTSVTIGNSVTSIGEFAFAGCSSLASIVVDASNTGYSSQDGVLYNKAKTVLIQYPPGEKSGEFTIPNSVTSIGGSAFEDCTYLTSVTIPNSVMSIESYAFFSCSGLAIAYFYGNAPSMGQNVFKGCSSNFTVCYTAGSTGFTNPWYGYPAAVCEETESSTTTQLTTSTTSPSIATTSIPEVTTTINPPQTSTTTVPVSSTTTSSVQPTTTTVVSTTTTSIRKVDFVGSPTSGYAPLEVKFTSLCEGKIVNYYWEFGDNSVTFENAAPEHNYKKAGNYSVILTVSFADGNEQKVAKENYINVSSQFNCPLSNILENQQDLVILRNLRDSMLNNIWGIILTSIYYKNSDELTSILSSDRQLVERLRSIARNNIDMASKLINKKSALVSADDISDLMEFLDDLKAKSSPKLQADIDFVIWCIEDRSLFHEMGIIVEGK